MSAFLATILFGLAAALTAACALFLARRAARFTRANAPLFAAFAGGVVITIALVHLTPEALQMSAQAPWLVLAGFAAGFVLHAVVGAAASTPGRIGRAAALAPVIAIALHSVLDGVVYAVVFAVDTFTGAAAALGLVLHEFPEALICFVLLQRAGFTDRTSLVLAFFAAGVTTLAAAAGAAPFAAALDPAALGALFALVAGLLLHVGAAHLLHEAGEAGLVKGPAAVFAGAAVAAGITLAHGPHAHHHHHEHAPLSVAEERPDFRPGRP